MTSLDEMSRIATKGLSKLITDSGNTKLNVEGFTID